MKHFYIIHAKFELKYLFYFLNNKIGQSGIDVPVSDLFLG